MPLIVGTVLALAAGLFATAVGLDRDRAFYPTVMIVIAVIYSLFAVMGGSTHALVLDSLAGGAFIAGAVVGFRSSLWIVAVALAAQLSPDVVVMDVSMPDLDGVEATRQILGGSGGIKVIALSGHSDRRFVSQMLAAGASGYLNKASAFGELVLAIQTVAAGRTYVSPAVTGGLIEADVRSGAAAPAGWPSASATLSPRERDVLQLLAESVAIALTGSLIGLALGIGGAFAVTALMRVRTEALIYAAVTPGTIVASLAAATITGLVFGVYPALRAARLAPVDAIRTE